MRRRPRNVLVLSAVFLILVTVAVRPRWGPPAFRYHGSDPTRPVWNLGWPVAYAIYDATTGFHVGPFGFIAAYAVALLGGSCLVTWQLVRWFAPPRSGQHEDDVPTRSHPGAP